jgi:hypothetical protein
MNPEEAIGTRVEYRRVKVRSAHRNNEEPGAKEDFPGPIELFRSEQDIDIALGRTEPFPWAEQSPAQPRFAKILEKRRQRSRDFRWKCTLRFLSQTHLSPAEIAFGWCSAAGS